jgi:hypothetical protein
MNQKFGDLNVAFGAEYRNENYSISAGQPESYNLYDINGNVALPGVTPANLIVTDFFGSIRNGSQVFQVSGQQILLTKVVTVPLFMEILNMMLQKNGY